MSKSPSFIWGRYKVPVIVARHVSLLMTLFLFAGSAGAQTAGKPCEVGFWNADWVTAGATTVAAAAAAVAAIFSALSTYTWRDGLKQRRADEVVAAFRNCSAAIGRAVSHKKRSAGPQRLAPAVPLHTGLDDAWSSWARVEVAVQVARRYHPQLPSKVVVDGRAIMKMLNDFCGHPFVSADGQRINEEFGKLEDHALTLLSGKR